MNDYFYPELTQHITYENTFEKPAPVATPIIPTKEISEADMESLLNSMLSIHKELKNIENVITSVLNRGISK